MYEDIINLSRPKSKYPKSTMIERAGQFMPFSALKGYDECIDFENRYVEEKRSLSEEQIEEINRYLNNLKVDDQVKLSYFKADGLKNGGIYEDIDCIVRKIDLYNAKLIFDDGLSIKFEDIYKINN